MPGRLGSSRLRSTREAGAARTSARAPGWHLVLRVCGGLVLGATGVEHVVLDVAGGYGHVPVIGTLFLFQGAGALALGALALASPLVLGLIAGATFALATLGGYLLALYVGLFGFHEVVTAAGIASAVMDVVAFSILAIAGTLAPASQRFLGGRLLRGRLLRWPVLRGRLLRAPLVAQRARMAVAPVALVAVVALAVALAQASPEGGIPVPASSQVVRAVEITGYGAVLATTQGRTLYVLRARDGAQRPCIGGCLSIWPPLLVAAAASHVRGGPGVDGALGLVKRGGRRQVTFNGYRLYTYAGDSGPLETNGEGVVSYGGRWYLVRASATRAATTAVTRRG